MKILSPLGKQKKGLSNMVAYVLLITITIALSILVYNWLQFYVGASDLEKCPDGVNLVIQNYTCNKGPNGNVSITLKNKGLFEVDGFILRVHDRVGADFGFYTLNSSGAVVPVGGLDSKNYLFSDYSSEGFQTVTLIEVQPIIVGENGLNISCPSFTAQSVVCN
tara:strand:+ start:14 stop:505 length:492 start_codon:yes stop_codon:yes gene_type:complete